MSTKQTARFEILLGRGPARFDRRARQKREGIVMLLVMLMLMMATGTALFTIQATQYEQRSATSVGEANWARGLSECTTMAALAYAEDPGNGGTPPTLGAEWKANGSEGSIFARKYSFPEPGVVNSSLPGLPPDQTGSMLLAEAPGLNGAPTVSNTPGGDLRVFLPGERSRASARYPLYRNHDSQFLIDGGLRYYRAHWLQETLRIDPSDPNRTGRKRTRTVVTGFAEVHVWGDQRDSSGVREIHELDAISRGYIDKVE